MFELRHLRTLQAIRRHGSLAGAAREQHVTLSALSHALKDLEGLLGLELLVRKSKPVRFTGAGMRLLSLADHILPEVQLAEADLRRMAAGTHGRLLLAMECHSCFDWLLPTLNAYRKHWPDIELDVRIGMPFDPDPALSSGLVDVIVSSDPTNEPAITFFPLFEYELVLVCSPKHPLARQEHIEPEDVRAETLITYPVARERLDFFRRFLEPAGVHVEQVRHAELTLMIVQLVASNLGVAALPSWAVAGDVAAGTVRCVRIGEHGLRCKLYAAVRADSAREAYVQAFFRVARETSASTLEGITLLPEAPPSRGDAEPAR